MQQGRADKKALRWISATHNVSDFSFHQMQIETNRMANALKQAGVQAGDRVFFLLPKTPQLYFLFLGALKLKAVGSILFSNVGEETILDRMLEVQGKFIITQTNLLHRVKGIVAQISEPIRILLVDTEQIDSDQIRGMLHHIRSADPTFVTPATSPGEPSLFHFTSGSTGKPKAVQHVHGSVVSQLSSFRAVMQPDPEDVYWCTADPGWVTGTSYGIIAPWVNGTTQIVYEGNYAPKIWFDILQNEKVTIWYSAPTVFRMLMQNEDPFFASFDLSHLKKIFCVGEPLNPGILFWSRRVLKKEIYDTWFQTETGSILVANRPGLDIRPGSMGTPLAGVQAAVFDTDGQVCPDTQEGFLCIQTPWPSLFVAYINQPDAYQNKFLNGYYNSGDLVYRDRDGYFWFVGRSDDVINTAGHLVSPFEVESALFEMDAVADVGVVGIPDEILHERIVAFVVLRPGYVLDHKLEVKMKIHVSNQVSSIAGPREIREINHIPKTKSGKIMRRLLRSSITGQSSGDLSTLEENS